MFLNSLKKTMFQIYPVFKLGHETFLYICTEIYSVRLIIYLQSFKMIMFNLD